METRERDREGLTLAALPFIKALSGKSLVRNGELLSCYPSSASSDDEDDVGSLQCVEIGV